ncbi:DUF1127 domain-containing protein [Paroceanicella profunda]|uniref:DUF1127 domain-containing protein n=2 Tax=Paroceanicella profunda TaxID=2579971 RepID=A0A5B8FZI0_9RHOB|nr:DUF1127 domain-containing protein [Paroceanicella profunda]
MVPVTCPSLARNANKAPVAIRPPGPPPMRPSARAFRPAPRRFASRKGPRIHREAAAALPPPDARHAAPQPGASCPGGAAVPRPGGARVFILHMDLAIDAPLACQTCIFTVLCTEGFRPICLLDRHSCPHTNDIGNRIMALYEPTASGAYGAAKTRSLFGSIVERYTVWQRTRATSRALRALSPAQLSDIGLEPGEIDALADTLARGHQS